jgi:multidrug efflux pump subunit AcrB
MRKTR